MHRTAGLVIQKHTVKYNYLGVQIHSVKSVAPLSTYLVMLLHALKIPSSPAHISTYSIISNVEFEYLPIYLSSL